jgi:hypothetical protein
MGLWDVQVKLHKVLYDAGYHAPGLAVVFFQIFQNAKGKLVKKTYGLLYP